MIFIICALSNNCDTINEYVVGGATNLSKRKLKMSTEF